MTSQRRNMRLPIGITKFVLIQQISNFVSLRQKLHNSNYSSKMFYFSQDDGKSRPEIVKSNRDETIEESTKLVPDDNEIEIPKTGGFVKPNEHKPWHEKYTRAFSILIPWNRTSK